MQAIERAPRWALKRLTATYVTLGLADIARAVNIESEDEVRELLLSMVSVSPPYPYPLPSLTLTLTPRRTDRIRGHQRTHFCRRHRHVL